MAKTRRSWPTSSPGRTTNASGGNSEAPSSSTTTAPRRPDRLETALQPLTALELHLHTMFAQQRAFEASEPTITEHGRHPGYMWHQTVEKVLRGGDLLSARTDHPGSHRQAEVVDCDHPFRTEQTGTCRAADETTGRHDHLLSPDSRPSPSTVQAAGRADVAHAGAAHPSPAATRRGPATWRTSFRIVFHGLNSAGKNRH